MDAAEIYKNNFARLCKIVYRRCRNSADAQDICQEAWLAVFTRGHECAVAYWGQAAINLAIDRQKAAINQKRLLAMSVPHQFDPHSLPERELTELQQRERFVAALSELEVVAPEYVRAFRLRFEQSLPWEEIATQLGISARYVQDHVALVVAHCRQRCA